MLGWAATMRAAGKADCLGRELQQGRRIRAGGGMYQHQLAAAVAARRERMGRPRFGGLSLRQGQ